MIRYEIRAVDPSDEDQLLRLAGFLNTVNLPHERSHVRRLIEHASQSFSGKISDPCHRKYVFLLWDHERRCAVGTSAIVGQLGRRDAPYIYLDVIEEEKYSRTLDRHFQHTVLRIGFSYAGPTELGGLVVDPEYRRAPERLGLAISYVRFLFIAAHRQWFQDELLAELLPPLEPDGTSRLWDALGKRFTDMSYAEADVLSHQNKDFIRDLFPSEIVYASLFSPEARAVIGKVGAQTRGVEKMLRRVGFKYADRIDPFDGGPHFVAPTDEVSLVRDSGQRTLGPREPRADVTVRALVAVVSLAPPFFKALEIGVELDDSHVYLTEEAATQLGVAGQAELWVLPLRQASNTPRNARDVE